MRKYIVLITIFIILIVLIMIYPSSNNNLIISEVLPSNTYTIKDIDGDYSDYIELYNGTNNDIDLTGYYLSDSIVDPTKWQIPSTIIKSKEYLLIFASGKNYQDKELHTNFKLDKEGETVLLTTNNGNIISKVEYSNANNDVSYSYNGKRYVYETPSPKGLLTEKIGKQDGKLIINEYMTKNKRVINLPNGGYYDWVEIYNDGGDINLSNIYVSDDINNLNKYKLPNYILKSNEYLVIYFTDNVQVDGYICANFKLGENDKNIVISSNDKIIDKVDLVSLKDNLSYGIIDKEWYYFAKPTPGKANLTAHFKLEE